MIIEWSDDMLNKNQIQKIEKWIFKNARPLEIAKWNLLFGKGTQNQLITEMLKYQNSDGGFGNGFEADILTPESAAIPSAEAIFTAQDFGLDLSADWTKRLLAWFENIASDTPSFWEQVPKSLEDYPHPFYWSYHPDIKFTPNPCAVAASALILHGNPSQIKLGNRIAERCIDYILHNEDYMDHDTYCLQRIFIAVKDSLPDKIHTSMNKRIIETACTDESKWLSYFAQPLDLIDSPDSIWYPLLKAAIPANLDYWEKNLNADGYWIANFGWDNAPAGWSNNWLGYIAVKRVKILKAFGRIEE